MQFNTVVLIVLINFSYVFTKILFDIDPDFRLCPGVANDIFDVSKVEVIAVNDSLTYLNGTFKILSNIKSPFKVSLTTQRFNRGQWVKGELNRDILDFCFVMRNRLDIVYPLTKHIKSRCPVKAGVKL